MSVELSNRQVQSGRVVARDLDRSGQKVLDMSSRLFHGRRITPSEISELKAELNFIEEALHAIILLQDIDEWECDIPRGELNRGKP